MLGSSQRPQREWPQPARAPPPGRRSCEQVGQTPLCPNRLGEVFNCTDELGAEYWRARFEATIGASVTLTDSDRSRTAWHTLRHADPQRPREPLCLSHCDVSHAKRSSCCIEIRACHYPIVGRWSWRRFRAC